MLGGWYCRSIANKQAEDEAAARRGDGGDDYSSESSQSEAERIDYRAQCTTLRKKLKFLIYENEYYQTALRSSQKRLLKACKDRSFLLDRLLQYEKPDYTSSESEDSESSEDTELNRTDASKKRRLEPTSSNHGNASTHSFPATKMQNVSPKVRKRPPPQKKATQNALPTYQATNAKSSSLTSDGHMTPEEVERHLQSRQSFLELVPERAPPTVPTEMFSNEPSLDSESNDALEVSPHPGMEEWIE